MWYSAHIHSPQPIDIEKERKRERERKWEKAIEQGAIKEKTMNWKKDRKVNGWEKAQQRLADFVPSLNHIDNIIMYFHLSKEIEYS